MKKLQVIQLFGVIGMVFLVGCQLDPKIFQKIADETKQNCKNDAATELGCLHGVEITKVSMKACFRSYQYDLNPTSGKECPKQLAEAIEKQCESDRPARVGCFAAALYYKAHFVLRFLGWGKLVNFGLSEIIEPTIT